MCYTHSMASTEKHFVHWVGHNGKSGKKAFPSSAGRAKVESFRRQKARDASVAEAWIVWASAPKRKGN